MADIQFTVSFDDKGTPVLKNISGAVDETKKRAEEAGRGIAGAMDRAGGAFTKLQAQVIAINQAWDLTTRAARSVFGAIQSVAHSAAEAELSQRQLRATLISTGQLTEGYVDVLNRQASAYQQVTRFSDEQVRAIQRQLIAFGASTENIERLTAATLDLAEGMGTDATSAAFLLGKALQGQTETLSRYGIKVTEGASATQKLDEVLKQVNERFGGQARAAADTYAGAIAKLANAYDDLKEVIGGAIAQNKLFLDSIKGLTEVIEEFSGAGTARRIAVLNAEIFSMEAALARAAGIPIRDVLTVPLEELSTRVGFRLRGAVTQIGLFRAELAKLRADAEKPLGGLPGAPKAIVDEDAAKKSKAFADSLRDQNDQLQLQLVRMTEGEEAAAAYARELLIAKAATAGLTGAIVQQIDRWEQLNKEMREAKSAREALDQIFGVFDALDKDQGEQIRQQVEDRIKGAAKVKEDIAALEQALSREVGTETERRIADINRERDERLKTIEAWRQWANEAAASAEKVAENNAKAAELTTQVWQSASVKIQETTEQWGEAERRAVERIFDATSDAIRDFLDGNIKSWKDFGLRIKKVIDSIAADFLTLQLKKIILGPESGKPGGEIGGVLGSILESLGLKTPKPTIDPETIKVAKPGTILFPQGVTPPPQGENPAADAALQASQTAATTAIEATATTAQTGIQSVATASETGIQTVSATAQAGMQTAQAAAQAAISVEQTVATAAIEAVKEAAIAAIQAAAQSAQAGTPGGAGSPFSGLSGIFGLFGGGGTAAAASSSAGGFSIAPGLLDSTFAGLALPFHRGGIVGMTDTVPRLVDPALFVRAPRYHAGTVPGLASDEIAAVLQKGETVLPRDVKLGGREIKITNNFHFPRGTDVKSFARSDAQISAQMRRMTDRAIRNL